VLVGNLDFDATRGVEPDLDRQFGSRMLDAIGDQLADQQHRVVYDLVGQPPGA
jgi:hypothetical protein